MSRWGPAAALAAWSAAALGACYVPGPSHFTHTARPQRPPASRPRAPDVEPGELRRRIVEVARADLGKRFDGDCSGWIRRVMERSGADLGPLPSARSLTESLRLASRDAERPLPGDLVFFHDTYDRDGTGRRGQLWTHVALVEEVDGRAATLLHRGGSGIVRIRMDLARPHDAEANDAVRVVSRRDPPGTRYLAAELFAGWGDVVGR